MARPVDARVGSPSLPPRPAGRFFAVRGLLSGIAGGLCCFAGALAAGLGLGGVSFFGSLMDRYQPLFLLGSLLLMGFWLRRSARHGAPARAGTRAALHAMGRPLLVMTATWSVTLVAGMVAARVAGLG